MLDPVSAFNESTLSVIVPDASLADPPPRSTLDASDSTATDAWIKSLLLAKQRTATYYDERLGFYLVFALPPSCLNLSRTQALSFFAQATQDPHLTITPSLSYYEGAADRPLPRVDPRSDRTASSLSVSYPLIPGPLPSVSAPQVNGNSKREAVLVPNIDHVQRDAEEEDPPARFWLTRDPQASWIAVWHFERSLPCIQTHFREPRLAISITATFRDDPKLDKALNAVRRQRQASENAEASPSSTPAIDDADDEDEEEYMDDTYDDVNLLSSLGGAHAFNLPFSRLPPTFLPPLSSTAPTALQHTRRHSRTQSLTSDPLAPLAPGPLLRRTTSKTFGIARPVQVAIRTVNCAVASSDGANASTEGHERNGMVLVVEIAGPEPDRHKFSIEQVYVQVNTSTGTGLPTFGTDDVEAKPVDRSEGPMELAKNDQFVQLWNLSLSSSSQLSQQQSTATSIASNTLTAARDGLADALSSVPIGVATSPSQRFTARFGADGNDGDTRDRDFYEEEELERRRSDAERKKREEMFKRNVEVIVKGRVLILAKDDHARDGYTVEPSRDSGDRGEQWDSPALDISSKWNYTIDIASFALRPPPSHARFDPPDPSATNSRPSARPTSIAAPPVPLLPPSSIRPVSVSAAGGSGDRTEFESIAGSKRHTMASLASMSLKSPILGRRSSYAPEPTFAASRSGPHRNISSRELPQTSETTPRRFFSLPPQSQPQAYHVPSTAPPSSNLSASTLALRRSETPQPINPAISPAAGRNSLPLPPANQGTSVDGNRRTSWMSGLGIGKGANSGTTDGRTSWDSRELPSDGQHGLGLGLETAGALAQSAAPAQGSLPLQQSDVEHRYQYKQSPDSGHILITVSLVPLRTVKSRRKLLAQATSPFSTTDSPQDLPAPTLPGLTSALSPRSSLHASFNFPPSTPTSPTIQSPSQSPNPNGASSVQTDAERVALLTSRMPRVGLLDVFLVQLFVVNQTDQVKRFVVSVPPKCSRLKSQEYERGQSGGGRGKPRGEHLGVRSGVGSDAVTVDESEQVATLVPLENDVRIGPLAPNSCASLGLRMLAISPGAHMLEELKLIDSADGTETRLQKPLWVVVE
ncbi:uncharacterized protein JCM15063_005369 [Sporobolomyces koalae]|uniref:uncharacterized protein n=1 Tax=Sporobolomyces koalae TaxID=500713 RepID=UPI00316D4A7A